MPGVTLDLEFKSFTAKKLHPTFAAEIRGVDFQNLNDETITELRRAVDKVSFAAPG
jgi:alpha-ketoglutarate-dependent 2,4-dichlorophenoxyacetate dioxygenase